MEHDPMLIRELHYQRFLGPLIQPVAHPTDDKVPHIDVYRFPPRKDRQHWTLITGGMSDARQDVPADAPAFVSPRTELIMYVWEPKNWMLKALMGLADMPFDDRSFLHYWHTASDNMPITEEPSFLTGYIFLPPFFEKEDFDTLQLLDEKVDILWVVPITDAELSYAMDKGAEALIDRFAECDLHPVVNEERASII
ncbi:MAG: suppressor of fused domain protein [Thermodesulfobacteriota bacterium]